MKLKLQEADELARNTFRLASLQIRAGGYVSIENPEQSLLWQLEAAKAFLKLPGVKDVCGDQCCSGGLYVKPTRWRSNCPWMELLSERCPGEPHHQRHQPLRGWVDGGDGTSYWLTSLGAEYPEGLCDKLARGYANCKAEPQPLESVRISDEGTQDPLLPETKKRLRQKENSEAIGGMRSPHISVGKIPGWKLTGDKLRKALDEVIDNHWEHCQEVVDNLGKEQDGFSEATIRDAQLALESLFDIPHRETVKGKVRADLVQAVSADAGDPDDVLPDWLRGQTPLGIVNKIPTRGIFPLAYDHAGGGATMEEAAAISAAAEMQGNYKSVKENLAAVEIELKRERGKGFMKWSTSKAKLKKEMGKLVISKVGAVITTKKKAKQDSAHPRPQEKSRKCDDCSA